MSKNSKYFDSIRISRPGQARPHAETHGPGCQWKGCAEAGTHRAPQGRGRDGQFYFFCIDHVRQYNASYNYFEGMSDVEIQSFQKDALTGHRPTWKAGANAWAHGTHHNRGEAAAGGPAGNPHPSAFFAWRATRMRPEVAEPRRHLKPLEKKALDAMSLAESATRDEIKSRFKDLVKKHHPDANGGDKASEDRLREIIQAYNYLKQAGLV